jgi:hypothetical protein
MADFKRGGGTPIKASCPGELLKDNYYGAILKVSARPKINGFVDA